jgi:hypothetical protein
LALPEAAQTSDPLVAMLLRVNWRLLVGGFQINLDSREVAFRTALMLNGQRLTTELLKGVVYGNVLTMNRCIDEVLAAFRGERSAAESFERLAL